MLTIWTYITVFLPMLTYSVYSCPLGTFQCVDDLARRAFYSDAQNCISIFKWCDSNCNCPDCEDEELCDTSYSDRCSSRGMFRCDNRACIPTEGKCDGFPSCPDSSDEDYCGCKKLNKTSGRITHTTFITTKRQEKCWDIQVPPNKFLKLNFLRISMFGRSCLDSRLLVKETKFIFHENIFTICTRNSTDTKDIETFDDTEIRYLTHGVPREESFSIVYNVVDVLCKRSDSFKCSSTECIDLEKKCDGNQDCLNGLDEVGCEKGVFTVEGVNATRQSGLQWLKNQRTEAWGWGQNTHRAVIALYLANGANFNGSNKEEDLTSKQLELQMSTAILRNGTDVISPTQLSIFINSLLVICHDPKNFYGYNLVSELKKQVQTSQLFHPMPYLALCNAGVTLSQDDVNKLFNVFNGSSQHSFNTDIEAMASIALSCATQSDSFSHLKENLTSVTKSFKEMQAADGSFGNLYTTALVIQALLASGEEEAKDWNLKAAIEFLKEKQNKEDGSFGDFLATYLIMPILNGKSLLDIGKIECTENFKLPRNGNPVSDIDLKLGSKISVNYFLCIGDQKDQQHPIFLRVPENITMLEMMRLAADADPKYKFKYETVKNKIYIYEIFGITNDPEDGKFWLLHTGRNKDAIEIETRSADEIRVYDNEHVVMWYKSATLL